MSTETIAKIFDRTRGSVSEHHFVINVTDASLPFQEQLDAVVESYQDAVSGLVVVFRRFFLSDLTNQKPSVAQAFSKLGQCPTSYIQQSPLNGTKIAVWVYCVSGGEYVDGMWTHGGYGHKWTDTMLSEAEGSETQMKEIFERYQTELSEESMNVRDHCIRTWIFVRDVDTNYAGVVKGRRDFFDTIGLTRDTHYIASTGIDGWHGPARYLVGMDAYAISGLEPGQVKYLSAPEYLNPTYQYGVTFERGTSVTYGDRKHIFISGTASIDSRGEVVHVGDVRRQTVRMIDNIKALLATADAGLDDVRMAVVYLRDGSDYMVVKHELADLCPTLRPIYVLAPVCRPAWLVEMECVAVTADGDSRYKNF